LIPRFLHNRWIVTVVKWLEIFDLRLSTVENDWEGIGVVAIGSNDGDNLTVKTTIQRESSHYPPLVALSQTKNCCSVDFGALLVWGVLCERDAVFGQSVEATEIKFNFNEGKEINLYLLLRMIKIRRMTIGSKDRNTLILGERKLERVSKS